MNDDQLAKLRKKASHALAQAAIYIHRIEPHRLVASKNFEKIIREHELNLSSPVPKTPFN